MKGEWQVLFYALAQRRALPRPDRRGGLPQKVWINEAVDMVMERLEKLKNEIG